MDKNLIKCASGIFILSLLVLAGTACRPVSAQAATENDLRYVTGIGRLDEKKVQKKIDRFSERLALDNTYNEMVSYIKANGLDTDVTEKRLEAEEKAYDSLMDSFSSGESATDVKERLSAYDKYAADDDSYVDSGESFDYTDTAKVKAKLKSLKALAGIAADDTDIGGISNRLPSVTGKPLHINKMGEGSTVFDTKKKQKIYCIFSGIIVNMTGRSISVKSGKTITVTYDGIIPVEGMKPGKKVSQKDLLGKTIKKYVRIDMDMNGKDVNVLSAAGTSGVNAYEAYMSENPWEDEIIDISEIKCTNAYKTGVKKKKKKNDGSVIGYYYDDNGDKKKMSIDTGGSSGSGNLFYGDPFKDDDVYAEAGSR